ncbi:MAG: DEAD/DEAH box helicase [Candidatus Hodarchaeota archaeon]
MEWERLGEEKEKEKAFNGEALVFAVNRWVRKRDFRKLLTFCDYLGYKDGKSFFKLDLDSVTRLGWEEVEKQLKKIIGEIPEKISSLKTNLDLESVETIKPGLEGLKVIFSLSGGDLVINPNFKFNTILPPKSKLLDILYYDGENKVFRTKPIYFKDLQTFLLDQDIEVSTTFNADFSLPFKLKKNYKLRRYQFEAVSEWFLTGEKGVIVLPTGAGKTLCGIHTIYETSQRTLIVVPTIDLLFQWNEKISTRLNVNPENIGIFGGGEKEIKPITVITYDSAHMITDVLADKFGLIIFDEVHHLPSPSYRRIAEFLIAPKRLGLSATPTRVDEKHKDLPFLVGPTVHYQKPEELSERGFLADYKVERIEVKLSPEDQERYEAARARYARYSYRFKGGGKAKFLAVLSRAGSVKEAKEALLALNEARRIAFDAEEKLQKLDELLEKFRDQKVLIFTRFNEIVDRIAKEFLIPKITHKTKKAERKKILEGFKKGTLTKIVTGEVLDEGVDVPEASVAIVISGTGSVRQYIQRLGRILRPKKEEAALVEIVTAKSLEENVSKRRKKNLNV